MFEPNQLAEIQQVTLAQVICESSDEIKRVQKDVFIKAERDEDYLECSRVPKLNLKTWSDCCTSGYFDWKKKNNKFLLILAHNLCSTFALKFEKLWFKMNALKYVILYLTHEYIYDLYIGLVYL